MKNPLNSRFFSFPLGLVLVLSPAAWGASADPLSTSKKPTSKLNSPKLDQDANSAEKKIMFESLQPAEVDPIESTPSDELILPTRKFAYKAVLAGFGFWFGNFTENPPGTTVYGQLAFSFYQRERVGYDMGLELLQTGHLGVFATKKWLFQILKNYEPYFSVGGGALFKPSEAIGSLININRYQIRLNAGLEDVFELRRRLRSELGLGIGLLGLSYHLQISYTF